MWRHSCVTSMHARVMRAVSGKFSECWLEQKVELLCPLAMLTNFRAVSLVITARRIVIGWISPWSSENAEIPYDRRLHAKFSKISRIKIFWVSEEWVHSATVDKVCWDHAFRLLRVEMDSHLRQAFHCGLPGPTVQNESSHGHCHYRLQKDAIPSLKSPNLPNCMMSEAQIKSISAMLLPKGREVGWVDESTRAYMYMYDVGLPSLHAIII